MRTVATVAVALLVVLAGCGATGSGGPGGDGDPSTGTTTPGPIHDRDTISVTHDPPPSTDDGTPRPTGGNTIAYAELTDTQQAAFEAAIDGEVRFVPNTSYVDDSEGYDIAHVDLFKQHDYVRYEGERYRLSFSSGRLYAQYGIQATAGEPDDGDSVTALTDLPEDLHDEVTTAIEEGNYHAPAGKWDSLPEPLGETDYVRYEGETYRMSYVVGDTWAPVMSVERVE